MKEIFSGINNLLRTLAANKGSRIWFILMLLAVSGAFYFYFNRTLPPAKQDQCDYLMEQNRQLVNALLMIKQDLENISENKPVSFNIKPIRPSFTLHIIRDTLPKERKQEKQIKKINQKIDSVLLKNKIILDSLKKANNPKKQST